MIGGGCSTGVRDAVLALLAVFAPCVSLSCGSSAGQPSDGGSPRGASDADLGTPADGDATVPSTEQAPTPGWAMVLEGDGASAVKVVTDESGNAYVAVNFQQSLTLGSDTVVSLGGTDAIIAKVSPAGEILWHQPIAGAANDLISGLTLAANGELWAIGRFEQELALPPMSLRSLGSSDVFLVSLSAQNGDILTARAFGGDGPDWGNSVAVDPAGRLAVAGWFRDSLSLDERLVAPDPMQWDGFLAVLGPGAARPDWVRVLGGFGQDGVSEVTFAADGDLAATGTQDGVANFGCGNHPSTALSHAFVVRYAPDGTCRFSKSYGRLGWNGAGGVAFTPGGDLLVSGAFEGPIDFGGGETVSHCNQIFCNDGFLIRLDPSGKHLWSHTWGDATGDDGVGMMALTASEDIYAIGYFYGTMQIGADTLPTAGGRDAFVVLLAADGRPLWTARFGGPQDDAVAGIGIAPTAIYLAGQAGAGFVAPGFDMRGADGLKGGALLMRLERRTGGTTP